MPRYDLPDAPGSTVTIVRDGREHDFPLPYDTDDPAEMTMLAAYPGMAVVSKPRPVGGRQPDAKEPADTPEEV